MFKANFPIRRGRQNKLAPFAFDLLKAISSIRRSRKQMKRRFSVFAVIVYW